MPHHKKSWFKNIQIGGFSHACTSLCDFRSYFICQRRPHSPFPSGERELPQLLNDLNTAYQKSGHALQVLLLEKTAQLCTVERYAPYIQAALEQKRTLPLTPAALEVLTIAAYHQPVTKRFIAHVRGIDSSTLANTLVERGLLEEGESVESLADKGLGREKVERVLKLFYRSEFKRRQCPTGPRVSLTCLGAGVSLPMTSRPSFP